MPEAQAAAMVTTAAAIIQVIPAPVVPKLRVARLRQAVAAQQVRQARAERLHMADILTMVSLELTIVIITTMAAVAVAVILAAAAARTAAAVVDLLILLPELLQHMHQQLPIQPATKPVAVL